MLKTCSSFVSIVFFILLVVGQSVIAFAAADTVTTVTGLVLLKPGGVVVDVSGNIFISDSGHHQVIMIDNSTGNTTTIGDGTPGFAGDNSAAGATTQLNNPQGLAVDSSGNLYIADTDNHRIRMIAAVAGKITAASKITTVAGNGAIGYSSDTTLQATSASLANPGGVAVDAVGNLYISDSGNNVIRKVDAASKKISTQAGDGKATTLTVAGITISPAGDLYVADPGHNRIFKFTKAAGAPTPFAGNGTSGNSGDGGLALYATLTQPSGISTNGKDLYIADTGNNSVRKISLATGVISTRAAAGGTAAITHSFASPMSVGIDLQGNVYVADALNNAVKEITASIDAQTEASVPGGTYITAQSVSLTGNQYVKTIYYSTDNTLPTVPYAGTALSISSTTTLKFRSLDFSGNYGTVSTVTYTFAAAPVTTMSVDLTPVSGVYFSARSQINVTLTSTGSAIYYTVDGKTPTTASTKYSAAIPILVPSTTTLKYFAVDSYGNTESIKTDVYTAVALLTSPTVAGGLFNSDQSVKLAVNDTRPALIYYTTDGSTPTIPANLYTPGTAIAITADTVLKYYSVDFGGNNETLRTQNYYIDKVKPVATASPLPSGSVTNLVQTISITSSSSDDVIYYTVDGKTPTTASAKYTVPIVISQTTTLSFFSKDKAGNQSTTTSLTYLIDSTVPVTTVSLKGGMFASIQSVALATVDTTASIYYTVDGSTPSPSSQKYSTPIYIDRTTTLKFYSVDSAGNSEAVQTEVYTIIHLTTVAYPSGGVYSSVQTVTLVTNSPGASIYYTTDGATPTTKSKKYSVPLLVTDILNPTSTTTVLQYFAVDTAGVTESVKAETYKVDTVTPATSAKCVTVDPVTALATNKIKLTATDSADPMPKIKYIANTATDNGSPVAAYTLADYAFPISFTGNTIVKFFAIDAAGNTELIKTGYCADAIAVSAQPSIYLDTLASGSSTPSVTLYVSGNVAPFSSTTLTVNGSTVPSNVKNGSFSSSLPLSVGANTLTVIATDGGSSTTESRTITENPAAPSATVTIGSNIGVVGNSVRVPITLVSGYQAAATSVDISYNGSNLTLPRIELSEHVKSLGKTIEFSNQTANPYRIVIKDPLSASTLSPLPNGIVGYVIFNTSAGAGTVETLANSTIASNRAADIGTASMSNVGTVNGSATLVKYAGDTNADATLTLDELLKALNMLIDPVNNPVNGSVDLDGNGVVSIWEVQRVMNTFVGK